MKDKYEISSISEVKSFMCEIEPQLENLLTTFYNLKKLADNKQSFDEKLKQLEVQFQQLSNTTNKINTDNPHIQNFINSVNEITKRDVIKIGNMTKSLNLDFFDLMRKEMSTNNYFNYGYWGKMNKRIQQYYLRIYSFYSKCLYELLKKEIEK